jgi:hypothetical protein
MCILDKGNGRRINSQAAIIPCARREARRTNIHDDSSMETGGGFFWGGALQPVGKNSQRFPGAEDSNRHSSGAGVGAYGFAESISARPLLYHGSITLCPNRWNPIEPIEHQSKVHS